MKKTTVNKSTKPPTPDAASVPANLQVADVIAMKQADRVAAFKTKDATASRIFIDLSKLFSVIESNLPPGEKIFPYLIGKGIRKGSVSNASQAAKVLRAFVPQHIKETVYDTLSWADINLINRVMSAESKKRMLPADIADIIQHFPDSYDTELECLAEHGLITAEHAAQEQKAADEAAAAEQKKQDDAVAAEVARIEAEKKLVPAAPGPNTVAVPSGVTAETPAPAPPGSPAPAEAPAETVAPVAPAVPENIVPSGINAKSRVLQAGNLIDALELMFAEMTIDEARKAAPRLVQLADTVMSFCATSEEENAKALAA